MIQPAFDISDPVLARAAWSRLAEPGDTAAAVLVRQAGPVAALTWLVTGRTGADAALEGSGIGPAGGRAGGPDGAVRPNGGRSANGIGHLPGGGVAAARARWLPRLENLDPRRELRVLAAMGGVLLGPGDPGWPAGLEDLGPAAPFALWVRGAAGAPGRLTELLGRSVAIVGSRACTAYGESVTATITGQLVEAGFAIVSGGAFGIDAAAHRATLAAGGFTVAVMAGGIDRLYPPGNDALLRAITREGVVVSELPPGSAPRKERFLDRNRLIAAMAQVTVVTESGWRSGAHRTAAVAANLARPVGAVPGPVTSAMSAGCHRLIREGAATLVTDARDVLELAGPLSQAPAPPPGAEPPGPLDGLPPLDRRLLDALPLRRPAGVNTLVTASGLATSQVLGGLARLERAGLAIAQAGAWRRAPQPRTE